VVLIDAEAEWVYDPAAGFSKSRNSPWTGETLTGRVISTWVGGRKVHDVAGEGRP
jgi:dihydroorotase